jgi:hypothetical protein
VTALRWFLFAIVLVIAGCISRGTGSDFDLDGLRDRLEDLDDDLETDVGETNLADADTDDDGLCDGLPETSLPVCSGCEDCDGDGVWDPCLGESDPLNADTDHDGITDGRDPHPLDGSSFDCSGADLRLPYGSSRG